MMWARLKKEYDEWVAAQPPTPILITLPDGRAVPGEAWRTTPYEVAQGIRYGGGAGPCEVVGEKKNSQSFIFL